MTEFMNGFLVGCLLAGLIAGCIILMMSDEMASKMRER